MKPLPQLRSPFFPLYARAWCGALLLACSGFLFSPFAKSDLFRIDSVKINAPAIHGDSLIYTLDIHFLDRPGPFWSYYDPDAGSIIVEFFDAQIHAPDVKFPKGMPFLGFRVKNMETEMALTKVLSRVTLTVDKGPAGDQFWNNDVRLANGNSMVRVIIWKEKAAPLKSKRKTSRIIAITVGTSVLLVFAAIAYLTL
jgi:hypothetical protein